MKSQRSQMAGIIIELEEEVEILKYMLIEFGLSRENIERQKNERINKNKIGEDGL